MKKLFPLFLMAIAISCFTSCGGSDDDDIPTIGTSYWSSKNLSGHWAEADGGTYYFDFTDNGTFTCNIGRGNNYTSGKYKKANSTIQEEIAIQFPKADDETWYTWRIEWLSSDRKKMLFGIYTLEKQ